MTMKQTTYLTAKQLSLGYRQGKELSVILEGLNLQVQSSQLIGLIGENGAGKSTLLKSIMGMIPVLQGNLKIMDKDIHSLSPRKKARLIAYVEASANLPGNLRVHEVVAYGRYPYSSLLGKPDQKAKTKMREAMKQMNVLQFADRQLYQLSDGEKQRCMIARAIAQDTPVIMLDEPAAHLDIANRYELMRMLRRLAEEQGKSIIMSSHDLDIVLNFTDKIWLIHQKNIIAEVPEDLVVNGNIELLVGASDLNFSMENAKFELPVSVRGVICLKGEGQIFQWTKRALTRIGFDVKCNKSEGVNVIVKVHGDDLLWEIHFSQDNSETVHSIERLIESLKSYHYERT